MKDIDVLREKVIGAKNYVDDMGNRLHEAKQNYWKALNEYSNAVAWQEYGFKIGDVIEFTRKSFRKTETIQMKITRFNASVRNGHDLKPSIDGIRVKKGGALGTKEEHVYPSLKEDYYDIKLVKRGE